MDRAQGNEVVAVVVTLSDSPRLRRTITSVQEALKGVDHTIVVVINTPGEVREEQADGVQWRHVGMNLGWAAGVHAGLEHTFSRYVWVLQDDLTVAPDTYRNLAAALEADATLGSVRPVNVDSEGFIPARSLGSIVDAEGTFVAGFPPESVAAESYVDQAVSFLPSSGQLIRREVWDEIGGFDPWIYPWGYIDVDFGRTLTACGFTFRTVADARMTHDGGGSTNHPFRILLGERNRWLFAEKWREPAPELSKPLADPAIVAAMRAARAQPRDLDLPGLQRIAGICAADALLGVGRALPRFEEEVEVHRLAREWAEQERDRARMDHETAAKQREWLRAERDAMVQSKAWRAAEAFRRIRSRGAKN